MNAIEGHTPLPWKICGESIVTDDDQICIAVIEDDGGYQATPEQREQNKQLIVRAVNSHAELVAALERITNMHKDQVFICGKDDEEMVYNALAKAESALAKAKGGQ